MSVPKHYTLKKDHADSYEIHDSRDDKAFHVAKKGLTLDMLGKLSEVPQYAGGGEVEEETPQAPGLLEDKAKYFQTIDPSLSYGNAVAKAAVEIQGRKDKAAYEDAAPLRRQQEYDASIASLPTTPAEAARQESGPPLQGVQVASLDPASGMEALTRSPAMARAPSAPGLTPATPDNLTPAAPLANTGTPYDTATAVTPTPEVTNPLTAQLQAQEASDLKYRNSISAFAKAKAEQGKGAEQAWGAYQEGLKSLKSPQEYSKELATLDAEWQKQALDPKNNTRDYFASKSTPQKLAIGIGLILGGAGGGRHGKNQALETLNNAIEQDIQGQKDKQSQTMSLWKMNRERLKNDYEADVTTRSQLLEIAKAELQKGAAKIMAPEAQMNAAAALKTIDGELAKNRMMRTLMAQGSKTKAGSESEYIQNQKIKAMLDPKSTEHDGDLYIPGVGIARVKVPEKTREQLIGLSNMKGTLGRAKEFAQAVSSDVLGTIPKTTQATRSSFLQQQLLYGFKEMAKLGVLSDEEYDRISKIIPAPGQMNTGAALAAYEELGKSLEHTEKNYLMSAGVTPFEKPPQANMHRQLFEQNINSPDPLKRQQATELGRIHGWVK